jgi:prophage regulatory protein
MQPKATASAITPRKTRVTTQPLHALQIADALLKIKTVTAVTGLSESSIRRKVNAGQFPQPVKDGSRCTRWVASGVSAWLHAKGVV